MAAAVESRECPKCGTKYRTKLKKGKEGPKDARPCPRCALEVPTIQAKVMSSVTQGS